MPVTFRSSWFIAALVLAGLALPAAAQQQVYQCGNGRSPTYTEAPCTPGRIVDTDDAPVPPRRHQARVLASDREECDRLKMRMPVEQARAGNPDAALARDGEEALAASRRRFKKLGC